MSVGDIMKMDSIIENMSPENRAIFQAELLYQQLVEIIEKYLIIGSVIMFDDFNAFIGSFGNTH